MELINHDKLSNTFLANLVNVNITGEPIKVDNIRFLTELGRDWNDVNGQPSESALGKEARRFNIFDIDTADKDRVVAVLKGLNTQLTHMRISVERFDRLGTSCIVLEQISGDFNQLVEQCVHELSTAGADPKEWLWSEWTQIEAQAWPGRILALEGGSTPTREWEQIYGPDRERGP